MAFQISFGFPFILRLCDEDIEPNTQTGSGCEICMHQTNDQSRDKQGTATLKKKVGVFKKARYYSSKGNQYSVRTPFTSKPQA